MQIEKKYLTEKEVALLTGLALSTLRNWRFMRKNFQWVKIGRSVRYPKSDVVSFMEDRKVKTDDV